MLDGNQMLDSGAKLLSFTETGLLEEISNNNLLIKNFQKHKIKPLLLWINIDPLIA